MIVGVDMKQVQELARALEGTKRGLQTEMRVAINKTVNSTFTKVSRDVRKEVMVKARDIKKVMRKVRPKGGMLPNGKVILEHEKRLSLKYFGAKQNKRKRSGVSYQISRKGGRKILKGGFMGPRPGVIAPRLGGHVFARKGKARLPIQKKFGVSPWGVYLVNDFDGETRKFATNRLQVEMNRRIDFVLRRLK